MSVVAIVDGTLVENVAVDGPGFDPAEREKVPVPDGLPVTAGWLYKDGEFKPPSPSLTALRAEKLATVMALRDARIVGGFTFAGERYQTRPEDRENIAGAAQLAFMALVAGAKAGDLRWASPDTDFVWIAEDNGLMPMDAPTMVAFGKAAAGYKQACIFAAFMLKGAIESAADVAALDAIDLASGWPA